MTISLRAAQLKRKAHHRPTSEPHVRWPSTHHHPSSALIGHHRNLTFGSLIGPHWPSSAKVFGCSYPFRCFSAWSPEHGLFLLQSVPLSALSFHPHIYAALYPPSADTLHSQSIYFVAVQFLINCASRDSQDELPSLVLFHMVHCLFFSIRHPA